jgi:enamine deaminase RidA (YjgF/YER057c/UK114 family)
MARRKLILGAAGVGMLAGAMSNAHAQPTAGPGGIEWLDYNPPRRYAAGARVGNIAYMAGEVGSDLATGKTVPGGIGPQTERAFENIRTNLRALGSDLQYIFRMTTYLVKIEDISVFAQTRARFLPRAVPATTVAVPALASPDVLIEIEVTALIPGR